MVGAGQALWAFAAAALVFVVLLAAGSLVVSSVTGDALRPIRMTGPAVRRWSGYVLIAIGAWFLALSLAPGPVLLG